MDTNIKEIKRLLDLARRNSLKAQAYADTLLTTLKENGVDPSEITNDHLHYENANNLEEAILCYISYGECSSGVILDDIQQALNERGCDV